MQTALATQVAYAWKPWTIGVNWRGLTLLALLDAPSSKATLDQLCDVIGRHPNAFAEPRWKEKILEALESNPDEFVLDEHGQWGLVDEDESRVVALGLSAAASAKWQEVLPHEVRRTIENMWQRVCAE